LLRHSPEQGRARPDLRPSLRIIPYGRSVVIAYQAVGHVVEILRIFYGGQDYETIMGSELEEE
jgi:toxin ParE1/3/4